MVIWIMRVEHFSLSKKFNVPIEGPHKEDEYLISALEEHGKMYGLSDSKNFLPDRWLEDGDQLELDGINFGCLPLPRSHTITLFSAPKNLNLLLLEMYYFKGSIGRTDFQREEPC